MLCRDCPRAGERSSGERGPIGSRLLLVGMSPGREELILGKPFVGPSGRILAAALGEAGLSITDARIINTVNCLPMGGIKTKLWVEGEELVEGTAISAGQHRACEERFAGELRASQAEVVVCLGGEAMWRVTGHRGDVTRWRGHLLGPTDCQTPVQGDGPLTHTLPPGTKWVIPTIHPAYVQYQGLKPFPLLKCDLERASRALTNHLRIVQVARTGQGNGHGPPPGPGPTAFDIETDQAGITTIGLAREGWARSLAWPLGRALTRELLSQPGPKIAHNAAFDVPRLRLAGVEVRGLLWDTMLAHQLLQPDLPKSLDTVSSLVLDTPHWKHTSETDPEWYNVMDAAITFHLYTPLRAGLKTDGMLDLFENTIMPTLPTLIAMTERGLRLDPVKRDVWRQTLTREVQQAVSKLEQAARHPVNVNSHPQIKKLLYEELGLPVQKTDGRVTTDKSAIEKLGAKATGRAKEVLDALREHRKKSKLLSTYASITGDTVHPSYMPVGKDDERYGTATGRLSSQDPNIQNQPIAAKLMFVPHRADHRLVEADYGSIELRVTAALAGQQDLLDLLDSGGDVHAENARKFGCDRVRAKNLLYGTLYGAGPRKLMDTLRAAGVPTTQAECKDLQTRLAQTYPKLWEWREEVYRDAVQRGFAVNPFSRRRYFYDVEGSKPEIINFYAQSTTADIMWDRMRSIAALFQEFGGYLLTQVHDSFLGEVPKDEVRHAALALHEVLEIAFPKVAPGFRVPVVVKAGRRWGRMHEVKT